MRLRARRKTSSGDTIVEVLIAVAIVSSVLAGAFTVTQKSTQAVRDGQERSEVSQLLLGQVELVRAAATQATDPSTGVFSMNPTSYFCMNPSTQQRVNFPTASPNLTSYSTDYDPQCIKKGPGQIYNLADSYDSSTNVFTFQGHWDSVVGGTDSVVMYYKVYPGKYNPVVAPCPSCGSVIQPIVVNTVTCENLLTIAGIDGVIMLDQSPYKGDWSVNYQHPGSLPHVTSTIPYNFSTPLQPGTYMMWAVAKDNSPSSPNDKNQSLHYTGYNNSGNVTFTTGDTSWPLVSNSAAPPIYEGYWAQTVPVTDVTTRMSVTHAPFQQALNDDIDAYCLAYQKLD